MGGVKLRHGTSVRNNAGMTSAKNMLQSCPRALSRSLHSMDASGGPLVDSDGNIVGMNDYYGQKITLYVQTDKILECVRDLWFSDEELQNFSIDFKSFSEAEFTKDKPTPEFSMVEPTPPLTEDELIILDPWPSDDKERHFACTGVSIDCDESTSTVLTSASLVRTSGDENKIVDKLRAGIGGPLYDLSGNFVGMNFYDTEGTPCLPSNIILKLLRSFDVKRTVAAEIMEKPNYSWPVAKPYWYYPSHHRKKRELKWILE
ncbi:hypothetical protein ACQ4PT_021256 [Festuca glaucescens]